MLGKLDDYVDIKEPVTVGQLIEVLKQFDPDMPIEIGAEGVFQGWPTSVHVQTTHYSNAAAVLWAL